MTKEEIIKSLQETIKEVETIPSDEFTKKWLEVNEYYDKLKPLWGDEHDPCEHCSANPKNGGSGLCNYTLACPKIT